MHAVLDRISLEAPARLVAETRVDFRAAAMECLERARQLGAGELRIDMSATEEVDASGLGTLVVLQKRARACGVTTRLCSTQTRVHHLLAITRLDTLFLFDG
ncbi:MAG: STAS domain-containing protein [Gemmatimonadaceae bacterium]|nr:STAS domain-containing protein [Gemmatimonadaceae bacterium]